MAICSLSIIGANFFDIFFFHFLLLFCPWLSYNAAGCTCYWRGFKQLFRSG